MSCLLGPASVPSPQGLSYRGDLLAVQPVSVQEEGMDCIPCASCLQRRGCDIQEVLGTRGGDGKTREARLPRTGAPNPKQGEMVIGDGSPRSQMPHFTQAPTLDLGYSSHPQTFLPSYHHVIVAVHHQ